MGLVRSMLHELAAKTLREQPSGPLVSSCSEHRQRTSARRRGVDLLRQVLVAPTTSRGSTNMTVRLELQASGIVWALAFAIRGRP